MNKFWFETSICLLLNQSLGFVSTKPLEYDVILQPVCRSPDNVHLHNSDMAQRLKPTCNDRIIRPTSNYNVQSTSYSDVAAAPGEWQHITGCNKVIIQYYRNKYCVFRELKSNSVKTFLECTLIALDEEECTYSFFP